MPVARASPLVSKLLSPLPRAEDADRSTETPEVVPLPKERCRREKEYGRHSEKFKENLEKKPDQNANIIGKGR
jgi:hypothetical protein